MSQKRKNICSQFVLIIGMIVSFCKISYSQKDTIKLPQFNFSDCKQRTFPLNKVSLCDSIQKKNSRHQSVAEFLSFNNAIGVKSYGFGGIASSTSRGGNAQQSNIIWNGFSINSPSLGMTDLSLLPMFFFDEINLINSGASQIYGSASAGAALELSNPVVFDKSTEQIISTNYSSLRNAILNFKNRISTENFISISSVQLVKNKNLFKYRTEENMLTQTKNDQQSVGIQQDFHFLYGKNRFHFSMWLQNSNREIPPLINQIQSSASQNDFSGRFFLGWRREIRKINFSLSIFQQNEKLNYNNSHQDIISKNKSNSTSIELHLSKKYKSQQIEFLSGGNLCSQTTNYSTKKNERLQFYNYLSHHLTIHKFSINTGIRNDFYSTGQNAFTYHINFSFKVNPNNEIFMQHNKLFRIPSLNDLFWLPGGNTQLHPEVGYNQELGIQSKLNKSKWNLSFNGNIYLRKMQNLIVWMPSFNGIWTAKNIHSTEHYGTESKTKLNFKLNNIFYFGASLLTNYQISYRTNQLNPNDKGAYQQLMYCPMYSGSGWIYAGIKNINIHFGHSYTGYRYLSEDRTQFLIPFHLNNLSINYSALIKSSHLNLNFSIQNIFDVSYQLVSQYAMPGRVFSVGLEITFKNQFRKIKL